MSQSAIAKSENNSTERANGGVWAATMGDFIWLRVCCWSVALIIGAIDAWASRFSMYPDGVSYLDVGDAFWRGDWQHAINAYWSPLYPWTLGFFNKLFEPSPYWEYPLVHFVNFLMYVIALFCFDYFLGAFVKQQEKQTERLAEQSEVGLPKWAWFVAGYSIFLSSSFLLITLSFVSGDMIVAAVVYLAAALILEIGQGNASRAVFVCLGAALGIGYLAKAVMFLMAVPFFVVAALAHYRSAKNIRPPLLAILAFLFVAGPFVILLSKHQHRPTFGESGKINYEISVNDDWFFIPKSPQAQHPVRQINDAPPAYAYPYAVPVTYPLWFDPSYWHEGIQPKFSVKQQLNAILNAIIRCSWIAFSAFFGLNITAAVIFLYLLAPRVSACIHTAAANWPVWVPAVCGIGLYSLVVVEPRYVAALFCLLWIAGFSGVRLPASSGSQVLVAGAIICVALTSCLITGWQISQEFSGSIFAENHVATPVDREAAEALIAAGLKPGDRLAVIGERLVPSQEAAYVSRLARLQIVAELTKPGEFWSATASVKASFAAAFASAGARAILTLRPPRIEPGWERLGKTDYYLQRL
jgi:hypothetical protein